jgi:glycosyltransferase involved in cell wall biosynthesis
MVANTGIGNVLPAVNGEARRVRTGAPRLTLEPMDQNTHTADRSPSTRIRMLSVAMPVYNEEASIQKVVLDHVEVLQRLGSSIPQWEIVCIDDGSRDRTPQILAELEAREPRVRVIRQENRGIYGAFTRAYREARGSHIFVTGADGQWPATNIEILLGPIEAGAEVVIGVRTNRSEIYTPARQVISAVFNHLPQVLFGARFEDAGGTKLGIREVFEYDLISRSPFFEAERLILAQRRGLRVKFVPIQALMRPGGKAMGASTKNLRASVIDLCRCLWKYGFR